jgi:uncharacterized protein
LIVADTSFIYALLDRRDGRHGEARSWYEDEQPELATTPLVLAEADHLAATRGGGTAAQAFRRDVRAGAYAVEWWPGAESDAAGLAERYAELGLGLTDASLIALLERLGDIRIATFDERHFRAVRPASRHAAYTLLPADAG